jgi:DHA1 family tetracycline resistance protein-like MFS transporter
VNNDAVSARAGAPLYPILAVNFVGTLGFSIVLPFLVFLVTRWGGNALVYGLVGATYSCFQLVGAPILGRWSDRVGRRRVLLLSQLGTLAAWIVFLVAFLLPTTTLLEVDSPRLGTFAVTLPLLVVFVSRAVDGLTGGNISVATAYLADISNEENRSANFGKLAVSTNLGFVLGPAIAGLLGATVLAEFLPVVAAATISLVATLLIFFRLPDSRPCVMQHDPDQATLRRVFGGEHRPCYGTSVEKLSWRDAIRLPGIARLLAIYFLVMLGFNLFYIAWPVYAVTGLAWSVTETGLFFVVLSGLMALVQGPLLGRLSKIWSGTTLAAGGSLILAASFLFFTTTSAPLIFVGAAVLALGNGLMWPSVTAILASTAGPRHQGAVQGIASSFGAAAGITGMLLGGALFGMLGPKVFVLSTAMLVLVFVLALRIRTPEVNI